MKLIHYEIDDEDNVGTICEGDLEYCQKTLKDILFEYCGITSCQLRKIRKDTRHYVYCDEMYKIVE